MGYDKISSRIKHEYSPAFNSNISNLLPEISYHEIVLPKDKKFNENSRITNKANIPGVLVYDTALDELEQQLLDISTHHREEQQQRTMFFSAFAGELVLAIGLLWVLFRSNFIYLLACLEKRCCNRRNKTDHNSSTDITNNNDANEPLNQVISFTFDDHDLNNTAELAQQQVTQTNDDHPIYDSPRPARRVAVPQV
ncbi:hypothetical protein PV328_012097 [Microctonus aethiopoides]|uniref:Uncharacterized protein n=1 Tax=Microctonus aethiopoides TaxID=144406 RepID=A0AA39FGZ0_9HYME|nr:hypothetical protein PV328_012097 [Microctonus aethiopoides]